MDVLIYSRLGHGQSEGPPVPRSRRYFEQQSLEVLPALLAHFAIERPVLLGHSEGAAIALIYATMHPEKVRALVLESPILRAEPASAAGMAMAERAWQETDFRERLARHHRDPDAVFAAWLSIRDSDSLLTLPLEAHLPPVRCPLLVIEGEHDEYATSLQMEALRPLAPQTATCCDSLTPVTLPIASSRRSCWIRSRTFSVGSNKCHRNTHNFLSSQ